MHRPLLAFLFLAVGTCGSLIPACSAKTNSSSPEDAGDAALPPYQLLGQPCDPTLTHPCSPAPSCFRISCDPYRLVCVENSAPCSANGDASVILDHDAGQQDSSAPIQVGPCSFDAQCPKGERCGFPFNEGCSATGICAYPDVPLTEAGTPRVACGCGGQPVNYVTEYLTAAPVDSPIPCATDAGAEDATADARSDAALAQDASVDATGE